MLNVAENRPYSAVAESQVLVAVRSLATLDEIAASLVLAQLLTQQGREARLYLGKLNYPLRVQRFLPTQSGQELKFYQPKQYQHEFIINLKLAPQTEVKGVRWEQTGESLRIQIETNNNTEGEPEFKLASKRKFAAIYHVGFNALTQLEDSENFLKYTDLDSASMHYFSLQTNNESGADDLGSISATISLFAKEQKLSLSPEQERLLLIGAQRKRTVNLDLGREFIQANLTWADYQLVASFYAGTISEQEDLADIIALLQLLPQLNPCLILKPEELSKQIFAVDTPSGRLTYRSGYNSGSNSDNNSGVVAKNLLSRQFAQFAIELDLKPAPALVPKLVPKLETISEAQPRPQAQTKPQSPVISTAEYIPLKPAKSE